MMRVTDQYNNLIRDLADTADTWMEDGEDYEDDKLGAIRRTIDDQLIWDDDLYTIICANVSAADLWEQFGDQLIEFVESDIADAMEHV